MSVTLDTSLGELKLEIFCVSVFLILSLAAYLITSFAQEAVPRAAENFLALCASNAYNNTIFHRNIKAFMIQGVPHPRPSLSYFGSVLMYKQCAEQEGIR